MSGPRLFLIQGLCALVSINTEINTTLQSAPFINGVTHLMRALLTRINLPLRRGPSRSGRQLPAWILSASAAGRSSHPAAPCPSRGGEKAKPQASRAAQKQTQVLKATLLAFSGHCSLFLYLIFVSGKQPWMDSS